MPFRPRNTSPLEPYARVVIDTDTIKPPYDEATRFLLDLTQLDCVETTHYSDNGPPASSTLTKKHRAPYAPGWLLLARHPDHPRDSTMVTYTVGESSTTSRIGPPQMMTIEAAERLKGLSETPSPGLKADVDRDVTALFAAEAMGAHLFITQRPSLIQDLHRPWIRRTCLPAAPAEATAQLGAFLRSNGQFTVDARDGRPFDSLMFYSAAAEHLIHDGWAHSCALAVQRTGPGEATKLLSLLASVPIRLARALRTKDRADWTRINSPDAESLEVAMDCLDGLALGLMACFDVTARFTHQVLELDGEPRSARWQDKNWRKKMSAKRPHLALDENDEAVLTILRLLRNTIHSVALQAAIYPETDTTPATPMLLFPQDNSAELRRALHTSGGARTWGLKEVSPDGMSADLYLLIHEVTQRAAWAINRTLRAIAVNAGTEGLSQLALSAPRPNGSMNTARSRQRVAWQIGLQPQPPAVSVDAEIQAR